MTGSFRKTVLKSSTAKRISQCHVTQKTHRTVNEGAQPPLSTVQSTTGMHNPVYLISVSPLAPAKPYYQYNTHLLLSSHQKHIVLPQRSTKCVQSSIDYHHCNLIHYELSQLDNASGTPIILTFRGFDILIQTDPQITAQHNFLCGSLMIPSHAVVIEYDCFTIGL